eukprot:TRINITY_DN14258_c0_g1_i1.p2 TRINITY_DN14258_c0_g1~~TRINITY_DN14258_c0_g1_i1.p2  ORF type:complete len:148 (-),score=14.84 TRINITY_DN14258_c0_g1_i1:180-623(-)
MAEGTAKRNPLDLLMIDIDFFKSFNDCYGHACGDDCIRSVAATLEKNLERPGDFVARYGGEEFAVVLPETSEKGARLMAEKLRSEVQGLNIRHQDSSVAPYITISIGCATAIPQEDLTAVALVKAADKMLYQAKNEGRNQCRWTFIS